MHKVIEIENRINLLSNRNKDNQRIIQKLQRELKRAKEAEKKD